ncbi:methyltransferase domain-containing protein [Methylobacterium sp. CCH5-D2]|uniref:methyltransferase domain-containing protein n=1 Tax=Methylobacterium sp. CCH5-D2 TaxID=1768765 RepID=UPI0018D20BEE|nr:methyltransferase domain-containing protein [Methylobacterium sp. CCH5-D2]
MDEETARLVGASSPETMDVCEISGEAWSDFAEWKSFTSKKYPEFDVCSDPFDKNYDLIIAEQVFEHVRYPWRAAKNMFDGLKDGGYVLITTPFIFHIHPTSLDCWRWTPQGMGFMLEDSGFKPEHIVTGGWGNYECFLQHAIDQSHAPAVADHHPMTNHGHIPQMVWGYARKA